MICAESIVWPIADVPEMACREWRVKPASQCGRNPGWGRSVGRRERPQPLVRVVLPEHGLPCGERSFSPGASTQSFERPTLLLTLATASPGPPLTRQGAGAPRNPSGPSGEGKFVTHFGYSPRQPLRVVNRRFHRTAEPADAALVPASCGDEHGRLLTLGEHRPAAWLISSLLRTSFGSARARGGQATASRGEATAAGRGL